MIKIGILGDIGSGKSYVAKTFGYPVFNADTEVGKLYEKDKKIFNKLKKHLPKHINSFPINKDEISKAILANNSNLKNNYAEVKLWDYETGRFAKTGLQFCGLMMGDHSKCGINTMFNTGTVIGVFTNIYGSGFPRNFVPSFSWGGASGFTEYKTNKAFEVAEVVMKRRDLEFDAIEQRILEHIFDETSQYRNY